MSTRSIPSNVNSFYFFVKGIIECVTEKLADWTHIDADDFAEVVDAFEVFATIYKETTSDARRSEICARNTAQQNLEKLIRRFIQENLRHHKVNDTDLISMGIKPIDRIRTPHVVVKETVSFVTHIRGTKNIIIDFRVAGSSSKAKPKGYDGAVILWAISDTEPLTDKDYDFHTLATRTPFMLKFQNTSDSGKRCWIKMAWQNARGILGSYSRARSAIIP
jgi:hypothetical protein